MYLWLFPENFKNSRPKVFLKLLQISLKKKTGAGVFF